MDEDAGRVLQLISALARQKAARSTAACRTPTCVLLHVVVPPIPVQRHADLGPGGQRAVRQVHQHALGSELGGEVHAIQEALGYSCVGDRAGRPPGGIGGGTDACVLKIVEVVGRAWPGG